MEESGHIDFSYDVTEPNLELTKHMMPSFYRKNVEHRRRIHLPALSPINQYALQPFDLRRKRKLGALKRLPRHVSQSIFRKSCSPPSSGGFKFAPKLLYKLK